MNTQEIDRCGESLRGALCGALGDRANSSMRPVELARALHVDRETARRLRRTLRSTQGAQVLVESPGPRALYRLAETLAAGARDGEVRPLCEAIDAFESLIQRSATSLQGFRVLLREVDPRLNTGIDLHARRSLFKGASAIRGVHIDRAVDIIMIPPSRNGPDRFDYVRVSYERDITPVRRGIYTLLAWGAPPVTSPEFDEMSRAINQLTPVPLDADGSHSNTEPWLIPALCPGVAPPVHLERHGGRYEWCCDADEIGRAAAFSLTFGYRVPDCPLHRVTRSPHRGVSGCYWINHLPIRAKKKIFIVHDSANPGLPARSLCYDTSTRGLASPHDPNRLRDLLDTRETFTERPGAELPAFLDEDPPLARWLERFAAADGRTLADYTAWTLETTYPIYGSQQYLVFEDPSTRADH